jgi:hypothetical protein
MTILVDDDRIVKHSIGWHVARCGISSELEAMEGWVSGSYNPRLRRMGKLPKCCAGTDGRNVHRQIAATSGVDRDCGEWKVGARGDGRL